MRDPFVIVFTLYFAVMSMLGLIVLWLTHRDDRERIRATVKLNTEGEACDALLRVIEEKDAKIDAMRDEHETELNAN